MIRLKALPPPIELDAESVSKLTDEYIYNGKTVWRKPFIVKKLLEMSNGKCCYCECDLKEEAKYMEVEHFLCKKLYKEKVVVWTNLLPACKRCNSTKSDLDVEKVPIIHPVNMSPQDHIYLSNYRIREKTEVGKNTWKELNLNDTNRLCKKRFEIGQKINEVIEDIKDDLCNDIDNSKVRKSSKKILALLEECQPEKAYSATTATILFNDVASDYLKIKEILIANQIWSPDFDNLERIARSIALI